MRGERRLASQRPSGAAGAGELRRRDDPRLHLDVHGFIDARVSERAQQLLVQSGIGRLRSAVLHSVDESAGILPHFRHPARVTRALPRCAEARGCVPLPHMCEACEIGTSSRSRSSGMLRFSLITGA